MEAECSVCFGPTTNAVRPCQHPVCVACLSEWFGRSLSCPVCRGIPVASPTFDAAQCVRSMDTVTIHAADKAGPYHTGVTLSSDPCGGVRVVRLCPPDRAKACGLRIGDVITTLNGIVVNDHTSAVALIDRASAHSVDILCGLRRKRKSWRGLFRRLPVYSRISA